MNWVVVAVLAIVGGFMTFDGIRALTLGDYLTPSKGEYAGQLGPWSRLVEAVGVDPRSTGMKVAFVVIGNIHLLAAVMVVTGVSPAAGWLALLAAVLGLWYLPFGTVGSVIVLILVTTTALRPWR